MSAVIIKQGGTAIQRKRDDREQFSAIMIQLRFLATRADSEMIDYMRRNLLQQCERLECKELVTNESFL